MISFPNESIYSILARYHQRSGNPTPSHTYRQIFGKPKKRIHCYLPSNIAQIGKFLCIPPEKLLYENTLYRLYAFFLSKKDAKQLKISMLCGGSNNPTNIVDSRSNLAKHNYVYKYCPICQQQYLMNYGSVYWRIEEQLPFIDYCTRHSNCLEQMFGGDSGVANKLILPSLELSNLEKREELTKNFCQFYFDFFNQISTFSEQSRFESVVTNLANSKGLYQGSQINNKRIISLLDKKSASIPNLCINYNWLLRLLRHPNNSYHPLKGIVALYLLSENLNGILVDRSPQPYVQLKPNELNVEERTVEKVIKLYKKKYSLSKISTTLNISRTKVKSILKQERLIPLTEIERRVCIKALTGNDRRLIAKELNLSVGYVEQCISMDKTLVRHRKNLKRNQIKSEYRYSLKLFIDCHPSCSIKHVKANRNKEYHWLYRNDKNWLDSVLPAPTKPLFPIRSKLKINHTQPKNLKPH